MSSQENINKEQGVPVLELHPEEQRVAPLEKCKWCNTKIVYEKDSLIRKCDICWEPFCHACSLVIRGPPERIIRCYDCQERYSRFYSIP